MSSRDRHAATTASAGATNPARALWASGDYDLIAELVWEVGARIVRRLEVAPGEDVLDVACGTGNAAIPAARAGARVVGVDIAPELFEAGRRRASAAGVDVDWVEGDVEALPFDDRSFDVVVSTFGAMFAPDHEASAAELVRVLRPGGRLGLCNWSPDGNIGAYFRLLARHLPPVPGPPSILWGSEAHVRELFAGADLDLELERDVVVLRFDSAEHAVSLYETKFGPMISARAQLEPDGRWPQVRAELVALFEAHNESGDESIAYPGEYLVVRGRRGREN